MSKYIPYAVTWIDSCSMQGWQKDVDNSTSQIESVGWLVGQTSKVITLASSVSNQGSILDPITIPRVTITRMRRIRL